MTPANNSNGSFFSFLPCFCIPFQCIGSQDWGTRCPVQLLLPHKVMLLTNILTIAFTSAEDPLSCHHVSNYNLQTCSSYPILGKLCWLKSQVGCICILIKILVQICCDHKKKHKNIFLFSTHSLVLQNCSKLIQEITPALELDSTPKNPLPLLGK